MGSERGASLAHPHPQSDTPGARRERGGGAEPQTTKSGAASGTPSPGRLGVAAARPSQSPPVGPRHLLPSRPLGWGARNSATAAAWVGVTVTPVSPGIPPPHTHTDTHGGGRGDTHGGSAGRRTQGQQGLSRMRTWPRSRHPAAASHTPGNHTAALTPAQTAASHPSPEAAGHADSDRSPIPDPSPAPTPRRSPTQTHKSHTQTHTHTDSHARPLTLGATRRPQPGRVCVCVCVTRHLLASLPFAGTPRSHPIQAAPPEPPNLAAQPQLTPTGLIHTTRVTHSPSF